MKLEDNIKMGVKEMKHKSGLDLLGSRQGLVNITMKPVTASECLVQNTSPKSTVESDSEPNCTVCP